MPHSRDNSLVHCSAQWHFCEARNRDKLEKLTKRVLKIVLNKKSLDYQGLLNQINCSDSYSIRCQDMLAIVFKTIHLNTMPRISRWIAVPDPDLEIRGGGWGWGRSSRPLDKRGTRSPKKFFWGLSVLRLV